MTKVTSYPFNPVRPPKVRPPARRPASVGALCALEKMDGREKEIARLNWKRAIAGIFIVAVLCAAAPLVAEWYVRSYVVMHDNGTPPPEHLVSVFLMLDTALLLCTFPVAVVTRPRSRSDAINQYLNNGTRPCSGNDNPLLRLALTLFMLGLLVGEFLVVDAFKSVLLRLRLPHIDRHRSALILEMLFAEPRGIDPRKLLQVNENPLHLREVLGYLMAYEWADISPHGDWLELLAPSKRELRRVSEGLLAFNDNTVASEI